MDGRDRVLGRQLYVRARSFRAAPSGAAAIPPKSAMKSRRRIHSPSIHYDIPSLRMLEGLCYRGIAGVFPVSYLRRWQCRSPRRPRKGE